MTKLVTSAQAATILGVHKTGMSRLSRGKGFPKPVMTDGRTKGYSRKEIIEFGIKSGRISHEEVHNPWRMPPSSSPSELVGMERKYNSAICTWEDSFGELLHMAYPLEGSVAVNRLLGELGALVEVTNFWDIRQEPELRLHVAGKDFEQYSCKQAAKRLGRPVPIWGPLSSSSRWEAMQTHLPSRDGVPGEPVQIVDYGLTPVAMWELTNHANADLARAARSTIDNICRVTRIEPFPGSGNIEKVCAQSTPSRLISDAEEDRVKTFFEAAPPTGRDDTLTRAIRGLGVEKTLAGVYFDSCPKCQHCFPWLEEGLTPGELGPIGIATTGDQIPEWTAVDKATGSQFHSSGNTLTFATPMRWTDPAVVRLGFCPCSKIIGFRADGTATLVGAQGWGYRSGDVSCANIALSAAQHHEFAIGHTPRPYASVDTPLTNLFRDSPMTGGRPQAPVFIDLSDLR